jgi:hypothetical protein
MKVWIVTATSESGDDYGPWAFSSKPDKARMKSLVEDTGEELDVDGPGDFGSYLHFSKPKCVDVK